MTSVALTAPVQTPGAPMLPAQPTGRLTLTLVAAELAATLQEREQLDKLISDYLKPGKDYGRVPGIAKETLFKPGAEKVCNAYNVYPRYEILEKEVDHDRVVVWGKTYKAKEAKDGQAARPAGFASGTSLGLYRYVIRCFLVHRPTGLIVAEGLGSCSTMESKYVRAPREAENTALKMAKKRSHIDATLTGFNLSERFTQDVEDMAREIRKDAGRDEADLGEEEEERAEMTYERAIAVEYPFDNKYKGKPMAEASTRALQAVVDWFADKVAKAAASNAPLSTAVLDVGEAANVILEHRRVAAGGVEDPSIGGAPSEQPPADSSGTTASPGSTPASPPTSSATGSAAGTTPPTPASPTSSATSSAGSPPAPGAPTTAPTTGFEGQTSDPDTYAPALPKDGSVDATPHTGKEPADGSWANLVQRYRRGIDELHRANRLTDAEKAERLAFLTSPKVPKVKDLEKAVDAIEQLVDRLDA